MAVQVAGERYESITGQLFEIGRQLRQPKGYPFDPIALQAFLQRAVEGKFVDSKVVKPKATPLLGKRTSVTVPVFDPELDLDAFYQTKSGLCVWDEFRTLVLKPALQAIQSTGVMPARMSRRLLNESAVDQDIEVKLGRGHLFSELAATIVIAKMINAQWGGIDGPLLNNGYANLFYLPSCVVLVDWRAGASVPRWGVDAYRRGGRRWYAGSQEFASN